MKEKEGWHWLCVWGGVWGEHLFITLYSAFEFLSPIGTWEDSQRVVSLWNPPSVFVYVKHSRVSGITSLFLSFPEFPSLFASKEPTLPPLSHTHTHECTHRDRTNSKLYETPRFPEVKVSIFSLAGSQNVSHFLRCSFFDTFNHPSCLMVRLIRPSESIVSDQSKLSLERNPERPLEAWLMSSGQSLQGLAIAN